MYQVKINVVYYTLTARWSTLDIPPHLFRRRAPVDFLLTVSIHAANIHDTVSRVDVAKAAYGKYPSIKGFCGDMGYKGTFVTEISKIPGVHVYISKKIKPNAWEKLRTCRIYLVFPLPVFEGSLATASTVFKDARLYRAKF